MKKRYLFPCIMLVVCMIFTACTTPSQNIDNSTPPTTEQTTTESDTEAPENSTPEPNAELNETDCRLVLAFLEIEDENGVKNGEKINPGYNPLDYNTWQYGGGTQYFSGFSFDSDGRLTDVDLCGERIHNGKLVGELNLEYCNELRKLVVESQNIERIELSSELDVLKIIDCPELSVISAQSASVRFCTIENCPNVKWFMWNVDGALMEFADGSGRDYYTLDSEIDISSEGGGRFDLLVDSGDENAFDFVPFLRAVPDEGHEFLGWYDCNGELISTDLEVRFFDDSDEPSPNFYDLTDSLFMFITARFSE